MRTGITLAVAFLMGAMPALAQEGVATPPVPQQAPGGETAEPPPPTPDAKDLPVEQIPLPETKPADEAAPDPAKAAPDGGDTPRADTPQADTPQAAPTPETTGENATPAAPATPAPAYIPPEKARTVPEPTAPDVPAAAVTPAESTEAAEADLDARACEAELKERGAVFTVQPSISEGVCGVLRPIAIERFSDGATIAPATQMLCRTALAMDIWLSDGVQPALEKTMKGEDLTAVSHASTYVCRDRASESRISEHSRGSAVDIAGLELKSGRKIMVEEQPAGSPEDQFLADIRRAACGPFRTVLGPGTDADHDTHLHLDIAARTNGSTYCR